MKLKPLHKQICQNGSQVDEPGQQYPPWGGALEPSNIDGHHPSGMNFVVRTSGTDVRAKEAILVSLAFMLLAFSISLFFKHWKKNYWDINQLPYYAQCYEDADLTTQPMTLKPLATANSGLELVAPPFQNQESASLFNVACSLSRTHSTRPNKHHRARTVSSFGGRHSGSRSKLFSRRDGPNDEEPDGWHKRTLSDAAFKVNPSSSLYSTSNAQLLPLRRCHSGYAPRIGRLSPRTAGNLTQSRKLKRILSSCEEIKSGVIESGQTALGEEFTIVVASASPTSLSNSTIHNV